ncbi:hypothetical protein mRhiFer1_008377 [Rhinolophus ferrumequinum]|uniref:Uncharacterized protein n=1 Tax=Rhinolophus ferrumequinum TaxID=59479 RepID=A0A7J7VEF2_RHIFE|nr:hypothetical protein mRhiFer1_008377 [Rhinolophus ferrumequinum]
MDGSLASVERDLQVLAEWLPEEVKAQVWNQQPWGEALEARDRQREEVLTRVPHNSEETLAGITQVWDHVSRWEALEAWVHLLEDEPHNGDCEAEVDDASGDNVALNCHARPILKQKVKHEKHLGPGDIAAGNPAVTEFTTYTPYTPTELQELGRRCQQRPGEPISAWLLCLWNEGADSILCSPGEMEKLAFVMGLSSL